MPSPSFSASSPAVVPSLSGLTAAADEAENVDGSAAGKSERRNSWRFSNGSSARDGMSKTWEAAKPGQLSSSYNDE